jgi:hypothetical protein
VAVVDPAHPPDDQAPRYNCFAFAAGDDTRRWEPDPAGQYYWPTADRRYTVPAFIGAYETRHYKVCDHGLQERGYDKIAIYTNPFGIVQHVARQMSDGHWLSKLGDLEDIIHNTPQSLASVIYGEPVCYMRRREAKDRRRKPMRKKAKRKPKAKRKRAPRKRSARQGGQGKRMRTQETRSGKWTAA